MDGPNDPDITGLSVPNGAVDSDLESDDEGLVAQNTDTSVARLADGRPESSNSSNPEDDSNELVVLDPDHPLMNRFQNALKTMITRHLERTDLEYRDATEELKKKKEVHLELGTELYNLQQELAKFQANLERYHDTYSSSRENRERAERDLIEMRWKYKETNGKLANQTKQTNAMRDEMDNLCLRLFYMRTAKEEVRGDIAVMRRAAEKAVGDLSKTETEKMKQDLLVDRLVDQVDRLREEISMYDSQLVAQAEEHTAARDALRDAQNEITTIGLDRKNLMAQWNSSLIGLQRRNEAYASMMQTFNEKKDRMTTLEKELEAYKRSIGKEEEQNEQLTMILNKAESDIATVKKLLTQTQTRHEAIKQDYATLTRILHETESSLYKSNTDKAARQAEVDALRKQIEREYLEKVALEDKITEAMRQRLTMKKAADYVKKLTGQLKDQSREMEAQAALLENQLSDSALRSAHVQAEVQEMKKQATGLEEEIAVRNSLINKLESEITHSNLFVERKQTAIDQLNKKLEQMIQSAGGVELGPLEITINHLNRNISTKQDEIGDLEQQWLRDQQELVRLLNEKDELSTSVTLLRRQFTILSQKKLRIEGEIESQVRDKCDIERSLRHFQNDMVKLNGLIFQERESSDHMGKSNKLMETDFVLALKEKELESVQLKYKLEDLRKEKEDLLNQLVETERQIMLWEKRIQLCLETKQAVDSDVGQGEIRAMKSEIHRMEVRFAYLIRQQELLIQGMEKSVSRRDTIVTRGEAMGKVKERVATRGAMQRQLVEMKKKIKDTIQNAHACDEEYSQQLEAQREYRRRIDDKQIVCQQLQLDIDQLNTDAENLTTTKQAQLVELLHRQQAARYYDMLGEGKYQRLCGTQAMVDAERERQNECTLALRNVVDRLSSEFPQVHRELRPVRLVLQDHSTVSTP